MRKFLSLILAAILIFATVPMGTFTFNVSAATEYTEGDYKYTVENSCVTITKYLGSATIVTIPESLGGYEVLKIGGSAFANMNIQSVSIPDTITEIGGEAFADCLKLKSVKLSKSLTILGAGAFRCTAIEEIEIPKSLDVGYLKDFYSHSYTYSGSKYNLLVGPFVACDKLKTVKFENGVTQIPQNLFAGCTGLEEITIPDTVTIIEGNAFNQCLRLSKVAIGNSVTKIDGGAFATCISLPEIIIPNSVTEIGGEAFADCLKLKSVTLSKSLTILGAGAFRCTVIEEIEIPKSLDVGYLKDYYSHSYTYDGSKYNLLIGPFVACDKLKTVKFENGVTQVPQNLFAGCTGLEEILIPDTVTIIEGNAFNQCLRLSKVTIGNSVTKIDGSAFATCISLPEIIIPNSVTEIGGEAFASCSKLKNVTLSKALKTLGYGVFKTSAIEEIEIPKSLQNAYTRDFYSHTYQFDGSKYNLLIGPFVACDNLKTATFEEGTTEISQNLFAGCTGLEEITIPDTVTIIEGSAFNQCLRLSKVTIGNSVTKIDGSAFASCKSLKSIVIPDSVISMGQNIFNACSSLESVKLPNQCQNIMVGMFRNCTSLESIDFPKTVTTIQEYAFQNCTSLENFTFSEGESNLIEIHKSAFEGCTALKEVILPESTTTIREYAFKNCDALTKVYIPQSTKTIGREVFNGCDLLSDVTISDYSITTLTSQMFKNCPALKKITLPKGLTKIESQAFNNCTALVEVYIPESVTSISTDAFSYPDKTTIYGKSGSYAETFAKDNNFKFVDNTVAAEGIALLDGIESITLERGETYRAEFEFFPEDSTDVITLVANNGNVSINGMDINARYAGETVITATASSGVTYEFTVHIRDAKGISITKQPDKLTYLMGEALDTTGMIVQVNYSDSTTEEVTDYTITGFDSSKEGECTVTVQWISAYGNTYKSTFTVTIVDPRPKLTGIYISSLPNKLEYERKESLNLEGLVVNGSYTDGSDVAIEDYQVSGFNPLKNGVQTITITCGDFTTTFTVTVGIKLESIKISKLPNKTKYYIGESIDISGMELTLVYTDGSETVVTEGFAITGFDSDTVGEKTITVTYGAFSQTFIVEVNDKNAVKSGDINSDGNINNKDLGLLMQYLNNWDVEIVTDAADVNGDGSVNNKDYGLLMQYLNNWDVELK